jgi:hypothetical protein
LPPPLACYERLYGLHSDFQDGRFFLKLPPAAPGAVSLRIAYDDEEAKDLAARLAHPDIEDQFRPPYQKGVLGRELSVDSDPGRARMIEILFALYPTGEGQLVPVPWFSSTLRVHRRIAEAVGRVRARLAQAVAAQPALLPWLEHPGGGYVHRRIAGTDRLSAHAFGIAIDINAKRSEYWRWEASFPIGSVFQRPVPAAIVDAFEAEGFIWGGRWYHYDTMHFEYRPELLDPACQPAASVATKPASR